LLFSFISFLIEIIGSALIDGAGIFLVPPPLLIGTLFIEVPDSGRLPGSMDKSPVPFTNKLLGFNIRSVVCIIY